jgi:hypothetical protein
MNDWEGTEPLAILEERVRSLSYVVNYTLKTHVVY